METANDWLTQASELLGRLYGLPGYTTVFISCIGLGLLIKHTRMFNWLPNDSIKIAVPLWGAVFMAVTADPMTDSLPFRIWMGKNVLVGFIIGIGSILFHAIVVKPLFKKFKVNLDDTDPAAFRRAVEKAVLKEKAKEKRLEQIEPQPKENKP